MRWLILAGLLTGLTSMVGCKKDYEALPDSACPKIVAHSRALLGEGAKDKTDEELMGVCEASSPKQRGCVMAATEGSDIMKCTLVRD